MKIATRAFYSGFSTARFDFDLGEIHQRTAHVGFPESRLLVDNLDDYALAYGPMASQTYLYGTNWASSSEKTIDVVGILGTNRFRGIEQFAVDVLPVEANQIRLWMDKYPLNNRRRPEIVTLVQTNSTGSIADISDPVDPPFEPQPVGYVSTHLVATSAIADTIATITFANHNATERPLLTASGTQSFRAHYRFKNGLDEVPSVELILRQNGADVGSLGFGHGADKVIKTSEGWIFHWTNQSLALPSATQQVGIRLVGSTESGDTPELIDVEWIAGLSGVRYDSGWTDIPTAERSHVFLPDYVVPFNEILYFLVEFSDFVFYTLNFDYSPHTVVTATPINGLGYTGRVVGGPAIDVPMEGDSSYIPRKVQGPNNVSRVYQGGLRSPRNAATWWEADVVVCAQKQSRIFGELEDQFNALGLMTLCTLFIPDPEDLSTAIWACLSAWEAPHKGMFSGTDDDGLPYSNQHMYELNFSIVEKTGRRTTGG